MGNVFFKSDSDKYLHSHYTEEMPNNKSYCHHNNHNEILVFLQGNARFEVEGNSYNLKPYDILVLQSAELHRIYHLEPVKKYENYVCHVSDSFFVKNECEELKTVFLARPLGVNNLISGELVKNHYVMDILKKMDEYATQYDSVPEIVMKSKLIELLFHLNQLHKQTLAGSYVSENVRDIILFINEKIGEKISLDIVAEHFFMSKSHLCHLFKEHTGLTVNQYIKQKRFIRVKELRAEGLSLTDACMKAGFGTYSNFYKMYLNEMGRAPSEDLK